MQLGVMVFDKFVPDSMTTSGFQLCWINGYGKVVEANMTIRTCHKDVPGNVWTKMRFA